MSSKPPLVTIVIPVYNEEEIIVQSLDTLNTFLMGAEFPYRYQIIVADNASTDRTLAVVMEYATEHSEVSLLKLTKKGKGYAIRTAWEHVEDGVLSFMDADLSSDITSFKSLIDTIVLGFADLSIGNRLGENSKIVSVKKFRKFSSRVYNVMARAFLRTGIDDHQCGFKAISSQSFKTLIPDLTETGFFFDTELIAVARKRGLLINQEDIVWIDSPTSKVSIISDSLKMFWSVVKLSWRLNV